MSEFILTLNVYPWRDAVEYLDDASDAWSEVLGDLGPLIDYRIDESVPDFDTYKEKIVDRASATFERFVSDRYRTKVMVKFRSRLTTAYSKWVEHRKKVMVSDGGREFKDRINRKKDRYRESAIYLYPWVGYKNYVWGAGTIVVMYSTGDMRAVNECEIYTSLYGGSCSGDPVFLVDLERVSPMRTAMMDVFARLGSTALMAVDLGMRDVAEQMLNAMIAELNDVFNYFAKPGAYLSVSYSISDKIELRVVGGIR